ncbi:DUF1697 domain-containing protein [Microbacterium rhizomatis]|uniref:DUF1697 domain-containing protein n=1 Tax=Microbacterium rhizomatis TaxID=1631477 RepID=A0A5J5J3D2_9MICO|nr:DUF1697 domain-containing protein [Microbacterium rhizomatis]KAA9110540.1 DUF1697 domain-containing protein [Microbacterium rhizomatis]
MATWVALLRGVNVNGITVRSAELRSLFIELGFADVRTILASGNVVFTSPRSAADLKRTVEAGLRERFGYDAWIVLVTREAVAAGIAAFPFDAADADRQPYVIFGSDAGVLAELIAAAEGLDREVDPIARGDGVVYWNPVKGTTVDTPFGKLLSRRAYRETTTNRNLRTLQKIVG